MVGAQQQSIVSLYYNSLCSPIIMCLPNTPAALLSPSPRNLEPASNCPPSWLLCTLLSWLNSLPALALHCMANENMLVATVAMAMMAITAAVATVTQEVALPRWGNEMMMCDGNEVRVYVTDNAGTGATAE